MKAVLKCSGEWFSPLIEEARDCGVQNVKITGGCRLCRVTGKYD